MMIRLARFYFLLLLVVALACDTAIAGDDTPEAKVDDPASETAAAEECDNPDRPPLITKEVFEK
jgi:hypothetical protein